jgi:hypothetical protein
MRKLVFALAVVLASTGSASAQSAAWADKLFMNKTTHDFGSVPHGTLLKYSFPIKNIYAVPLKITMVHPSCGCVTAIPSTYDLKPQETATLDVVMDARKFSGPKHVKILVTVGPEYISTATLEVSAFARGDVVVNPGEINFGIVMQGQQPAQNIDVEYAGVLDFRLKEVVKPSDAPFQVTVEELYRKPGVNNQPGRAGYRIVAKLNADAPGGAFKHELVLKTNDPQSETMIVTIEGNVQSTLSATPTSLNLGTVKLNEAKTFKVQVRGNRPFRVTEIKGDQPDISAELPAAAAMMHIVTLRCQPTTPGPFTRQITIVTDLEKNASVTITVTGNAAQ